VALGLTNGPAVAGPVYNEVYGTAGPDVLYGTAAPDRIVGFEGDDAIYGEAGNDHLAGFEGNDAIYGGAGHDFLEVGIGPGNDDLHGGAGRDGVSLQGKEIYDQAPPDGAGKFFVTLDDRPNDGPEGSGHNVHSDVEDIDVLTLWPTVIVGSPARQRISTGTGSDDTIDGAGGADVIEAAGGNDTIRVADKRIGVVDTVWCGEGMDTVTANPDDRLHDCERVITQTGTSGGGEVPPPEPQSPGRRRPVERRPLSDFKVAYKLVGGRLVALSVEGVARGVTVRAFCASGCGKGTKTLAKKRSHGKTARLRVSAKSNVGVGDRIEVRVTKAKRLGRYAVLRLTAALPGLKRLRSGCMAAGRRVQC
jgi:Ca2+-binding RTX toxin-like protein